MTAAFLDDFSCPDDHDEETGRNARCVFCNGAVGPTPEWWGITPICDHCHRRRANERCAACGTITEPCRYHWRQPRTKVALCADCFRAANGLEPLP